MENASLYHRSNHISRRDSNALLQQYAHIFRVRSDGKDSLLDIGCGPGNLTVDYILPMLPSNFSRLVGVDLSDEMVQYASENFQQSRITFRKLDIGVPLDQLDVGESFDHITSFYCLHWVENQEQAIKNIYNLLSPGGNCLFAFWPANIWFDSYEQLALTPKWSPYMADVQKLKYAYQYSATQADDLKTFLKNAGFVDYHVTIHDKKYVFDGKEELKDITDAITPFLRRMSPDLQDEFIDEIASNMPRLDGDDSKILLTYKLWSAYARK